MVRVRGASENMACPHCDMHLTVGVVLARNTCPECRKVFVASKPVVANSRKIARKESSGQNADPALQQPIQSRSDGEGAGLRSTQSSA